MDSHLNELALKELLYRIADDLLILGHRNSEWTGIGPLLEEDIAFSSMAQDKIGQSLALYELLHQLGEREPDVVAFMRNADQFHNCQFVELPIGGYEFSLIRHFLYDHSLFLRFQALSNSSYEPLAALSRKLVGELRYHVLHASTFIKQLGTATEESISRLQSSLNEAIPYSLGIFEPSPYEKELIDDGIFSGEQELFHQWWSVVNEILGKTALEISQVDQELAKTGGRLGQHTEHLQPLLDEMSEVIKLDPSAEW
ncbi:MAG: phenylacetate-CoA oxygenase subunit PaaC [Cyclobacteriaceae bacterium]|nr:phenylacetate-CoA oxygenase subunit PaaC [Cyclobacteriaceae bacterium]